MGGILANDDKELFMMRNTWKASISEQGMLNQMSEKQKK